MFCARASWLVGAGQVRDDKYVGKLLDRYGLSVGQGMATFLSTGNITSASGLDLMQASYSRTEMNAFNNLIALEFERVIARW